MAARLTALLFAQFVVEMTAIGIFKLVDQVNIINGNEFVLIHPFGRHCCQHRHLHIYYTLFSRHVTKPHSNHHSSPSMLAKHSYSIRHNILRVVAQVSSGTVVEIIVSLGHKTQQR